MDEGGDDVHEQALKVDDPTEEAKKQLIIKVKIEKIEANEAVVKETGQIAQPTTSEGIFLGSESF